MTKEEIIATAIREAFLCGKEAGEESQRQWYSMQQKIEDAKQGKSVIDDMAKYNGFLPQVELAKLKEENEKLGKILEEKDADITVLRANLDERREELMALDSDHTELLRLVKEKDAIIAELRAQLPVPDGSPTGESPHTTTFQEGDQVVISKAFFDEKEGPDFHGTILDVLDDECVVLIVEEDSIYDDVEFVIRNEFIIKA